MAKKSIRNRELKRRKIYQRYANKRKQLKSLMQEAMKQGDMERTIEIQLELQKIPRNASPTRIRRRCRITGRSRGTYRKVGLSKLMFRKIAMRGEIPGLVKASW